MPSAPTSDGRRPRLTEVAAKAGVSLATVSNVLNHPHRVAPATRAAVLKVIEELGFTRNAMASALARGGTRTVGLVVVDLSNSLFVDIARRLAERPAAERPDAVIGVSDLLAMALSSELRSLGLRVPADVAVMGCDHNSAAWGGAVPLTSVTMEGAAMGAEGMRLLPRELEETPASHTHSTVMLEPRLVVRESTVGRG